MPAQSIPTFKKKSAKVSVVPLEKNDPQWIRARRELLGRVKENVRDLLGVESSDIVAYTEAYEEDLKQAWKISNKDHLLEALAQSDLVYGGDFHALAQSQRTHLKILRSFKTDRPVAIALECFPVKSQKYLDQFLRGKIDAKTLEERTRWRAFWGFPFKHYQPLLELAKSRNWKLIALNDPEKSLHQREVTAAKILRDALTHEPITFVYVLFGDLHLARTHLPAVVSKLLAKTPPKDLIIHQNSEKTYFQLARRGLESQVDVVRFRNGDFCVLASPPWIQWQSYIMFLEQTLDSDLNEGATSRTLNSDFDPTDHVIELVRLTSRELNLKLKVDDFSVLNCDGSRAWKTLSSAVHKNDLALARELLSLGKSFYLPSVGVGFLGRASVNHAAGLAGQYIHAKIAGLKRPAWRQPREFVSLIWCEAAAYFISKLINHKRQSETVVDLRARLLGHQPETTNKDVLKLALDRSMSELVFVNEGRLRKSRYRSKSRASYLEAARILGGMLGERLYLAYHSRRMSRAEVVRWLKKDVLKSSFHRDYERLLLRLNELVDPEVSSQHIKSKPERL